jgi:hypothetical protein
VGKYINGDFGYKICPNARFLEELISYYYPTLIVEYFVLFFIKKRSWNTPSLLKRINPFPKNIVNLNWALRILWWDNSSGFPNPGHQVCVTLLVEDGLMNNTGQVVIRDWILADAASGNTGVRVFLKRSIDRLMTAMLLLLSMVLVKPTNINTNIS